MPHRSSPARRTWITFKRAVRERLWIAKGAVSTSHPVMAHIIPIRRCNLSCAYCNEFDDVSKPVPTDVMIQRINRLGDLGTGVLTLSGGEPLLHPELDEIIRAIRSRGIIAGMITNGYLLTPDRVQKLNAAGLDHLQISIDNVMPDEVSKKSLKVLDKKLQVLAEHAEFHVNINSVVGGGIRNPDDALVVGRRALPSTRHIRGYGEQLVRLAIERHGARRFLSRHRLRHAELVFTVFLNHRDRAVSRRRKC